MILYVYPQVHAGTLEEDFNLFRNLDPKKVSEMIYPGGGLGINELFLDLWQLVLGGFWNQIFGYQAYQ